MKKKIRFIIIGFLIAIVPLFILVKREYAISLQKQAIELYQFSNSPQDYDKAIDKLNLAIKLAPRAYLFYATKADIFERQKKYNEAINEFKKIIEFKGDYAEGYMFIGMLYEKLKMKDSAFFYYNEAYKIYDNRTSKYIKDKDKLFLAEVNKAYTLYLLNDSVKAKEEFNLLKTKYPADTLILNEMEKFDRNTIFP